MADPWVTHEAARSVLEESSEVLGYDLVKVCRDSDALSRTDVVQPALFACDVAAFRVLESEGVGPVVVAGHSLGEYAALVAAEVLDLGSTVTAVAERGAATHEAAVANPGAMTALVGVGPETATEICRVAGRGDVLAVANENSGSQTVLSGTVAAIERAEALARTTNVKAVRLKVEGAFHSPLMQPALDRVRRAIARLEFREPRFTVIPNASGRPTTSPHEIRDLLGRQLMSPVRWSRTMESMAEFSVDTVIESGPSDVLTRLARRAITGVRALAVGSPEDVRSAAREAAPR
ncbi:MAG: ACP S-malonyltransferase [Actinomycetota bacterium]|nr:ACP S-malonyltransferase [Actinomycetota bacterium]